VSGFSIRVTGLDELTRALENLSKDALKQVSNAVWKFDEQIMGESKEKCPVHPGSGALRRSGKVLDPVVTSEGVEQEMGYYIEYALWVHEMLDPTESGHAVQWSLAGTGNKFLENALMEHADEFPQVIADAVDRAVKEAAV
jgi:hypothetical protein